MTVTLQRPEGVKGADATVRAARYSWTPGPSISRGALTLEVSASRGGARRNNGATQRRVPSVRC